MRPSPVFIREPAGYQYTQHGGLDYGRRRQTENTPVRLVWRKKVWAQERMFWQGYCTFRPRVKVVDISNSKMDERHWWIAGRIQESFHIGGYDSPTLLEDFMCLPDTLNMINEFLNPAGPCRLYFYCDKADRSASTTPSGRQVHIVDSLSKIKDVNLDNVSLLYFLRHNVDAEVDAAHIEKDVYCGELKGNVIESLGSLLSEIYIPIIHAQNDWGHCSMESQSTFMRNLDKAVSSLAESSASSHVSGKHTVSIKFWLMVHSKLHYMQACTYILL